MKSTIPCPIASISQTLNSMINRKNLNMENTRDIVEGLNIINERANGLRKFVDSYKQIARLPEPQRQAVSMLGLLQKTCILFDKQPIIIESVQDIQLYIDPVQFEQVLINLFKNSVEAMSQVNPDGEIRVEWHVSGHFFSLIITDEGGGLSNPDNLFVPFYTTKKNGSGIGLVFCRQVIEAHGGWLSIVNRTECSGCRALVDIPLVNVDDTPRSNAD